MTAATGPSPEENLARLLRAEGKHALYQMLPPSFPGGAAVPAPTGTPRLDDRRWEFLREHLPEPVAGRTVVDVGANIGYFAFRLAGDLGANVVAYEPHAPHAQAMRLIRQACGLDEGRFEVRNSGVGLRDIESLPSSSLLLLLNVLQHAGQDYDADLVPNVGAWRGYAVEYLRRLRSRTSRLFFQLGYTWLGHADPLCRDEAIIDFTLGIVGEAGWRVEACGAIRELGADPRYEEYLLAIGGANRIYLPARRHRWRSKLSMLISPERERRRRNLYRFAQRPLWILGGGRA